MVLTAFIGVDAESATYTPGTPITDVSITSHSDFDIVYARGEYTFTCTTSSDKDYSDEDELREVDDPVTYEWSGAGTFDITNGTCVTWTAPDAKGQITITVTVSDSPLADDANKTDSVMLTVNAAINVKDSPYNAAGDGITDDSKAIQRAINNAKGEGKVILLKDGTFKVESGVRLGANTILVGENAILKSGASIYALLTVNSGCLVKNLVLDGNNCAHKGIQILSNATNVTVKKCTIQNFQIGTASNAYGIFVYQACDNIKIISCIIKDLSTDGNHRTTRGIYIYDANNIIIDNCNLHNITAFDDGDCIYVSMPKSDPNDPSSPWKSCAVKIQNCKFSNFTKRGLKLQCSGAVIKNNWFNIVDGNCLRAGIEFFGELTRITDNEIHINKAIAGILGSKGFGSTIEDNIIELDTSERAEIFKGSQTAAIRLDDANGVSIAGNVIKARRGLFWHNVANATFTGNTLDVNKPTCGYGYSIKNTFQTK